MHCRMFSSIPDLYLLDASITRSIDLSIFQGTSRKSDWGEVFHTKNICTILLIYIGRNLWNMMMNSRDVRPGMKEYNF